ncbi:uncharacterized protein DS421_16g545380 [Arachis hypogaea]|nr:uncharacterized protein DS421_16g545380 [Arachis hypogaea]
MNVVTYSRQLLSINGSGSSPVKKKLDGVNCDLSPFITLSLIFNFGPTYKVNGERSHCISSSVEKTGEDPFPSINNTHFPLSHIPSYDKSQCCTIIRKWKRVIFHSYSSFLNCFFREYL